MLNVWRNGYPGDGPTVLMRELKTKTYNVRLFWENLVFTADPLHVKAILATDFGNYIKGAEILP